MNQQQQNHQIADGNHLTLMLSLKVSLKINTEKSADVKKACRIYQACKKLKVALHVRIYIYIKFCWSQTPDCSLIRVFSVCNTGMHAF